MGRVLVVEDAPGIQRIVAATLRCDGHQVEVASTGTEGVAKATFNRPDVLILDLGLPDFNGREVYGRLLRRDLRVPTLVLSAEGAEAAQRKLGAEVFMDKPFEPDELLAVVRRSLPPD